jgi:hypothetical protein
MIASSRFAYPLGCCKGRQHQIQFVTPKVIIALSEKHDACRYRRLHVDGLQ